MKNLFLLLSLVFITSQVVYGARECKTQRTLSVAEQLANLEPSAGLDLIDLELFPGGSFIAGYEYEVEPAYTKGLYSRTDKWLVGTKLIPGKLLDLSEGLALNLAAGLQNETMASFTRFFKDPCAAMLSTPYSPRRIPLRAKVAIGSKFNEGDYFTFRGSVGFVAGADLLKLLGSGLWGVGLNASYLVEGFYQLHIVRLDETHVRLKIVAHRGHDVSATFGLGFQKEFDVFQVSLLNNQLERLVNPKPFEVSAHTANSRVFMVDYVLDLTDKDVVVAYENILRKAKDFKNIGQVLKKTDLEGNLLLDITPLEDLYRLDFSQQRNDRIKRNLRTSSEQRAYGFGINGGNKIIGYKVDLGLSTAKMSIRKDNDSIDKYLLKSWDRNWDARFLYSWSRSSKEEGLNALFHSDETFEKIEPINIVKYIRQKKNRFSYDDFQKLKLTLKKSLPNEVYNKIPFASWGQKPKEKYLNYGLRYELLMAPESILEAPELREKEIRILFIDHLKSKGLSSEDYFLSKNSVDANSEESETFNQSLRNMSYLLARALNRKLTLAERLNVITDLRRNKLFYESGISFLMSLWPDKMKEYYHIDLTISSNESLIDFTFGDANLSLLYKKILTIKAALDDDALDLLKEAESLTVNK